MRSVSATLRRQRSNHAAIVHSTIAYGRTVSIDTVSAKKAPGVLAVFTYRNMKSSMLVMAPQFSLPG